MSDKLRIFQIGFNKCGTVSFHRLFQDHCKPTLTSLHWHRGYLARDIHDNILNGDKPLMGYESYSVFSDMECFRTKNEKISWISIAKDYFDIIDINYPNSKFVLNTRDVDDWILSRLKHYCDFSAFRYGYTEKLASKVPYAEFHKQAFNIDSISSLIALWKEHWYQHHDNVLSYFKYRPDDLLVYDIEKDNFGKFINFFAPHGISFDINYFPHHNKTINND